MSAQPGWHRQTDGRERYWDGSRWTDQYRAPIEEPTKTAPAALATQPKKGTMSRKHLIGYATTGIVGLLLGAGIGAAGAGSTPTASASGATVTQTSTVTTTATPPAATTVVKTVSVKVTPKPKAAITEGVWEVGVDIAPGKYKVIEPIASDCYWEINPTGKDDIVDNGNPTGGRPVVVLKKGQTFTNQGCGDWARTR